MTEPACPACGAVMMQSHGKMACTNPACYYVETCSDGGCGCKDTTAFNHSDDDEEAGGIE